VRLYTHTGIDREATVLVGQHLFGIKALQQAPPHEGAQDALAQGGLRLYYGNLIDPAGRVEDDARRGGFTIGNNVPRHFLKHPVHHTDVEMHMLVQTGAEAVNEGHCADMQGCLVHTQSTGAMSLQALRDDPQEDAQHHVQHHPITLYEVA